jgi:hypothetical protein
VAVANSTSAEVCVASKQQHNVVPAYLERDQVRRVVLAGVLAVDVAVKKHSGEVET